MYIKNEGIFFEENTLIAMIKRKDAYLCTKFFMVLDLRLTKVGLGGALFFCPYHIPQASKPIHQRTEEGD